MLKLEDLQKLFDEQYPGWTVSKFSQLKEHFYLCSAREVSTGFHRMFDIKDGKVMCVSG